MGSLLRSERLIGAFGYYFMNIGGGILIVCVT